jgi:hypothetical protein
VATTLQQLLKWKGVPEDVTIGNLYLIDSNTGEFEDDIGQKRCASYGTWEDPKIAPQKAPVPVAPLVTTAKALKGTAFESQVGGTHYTSLAIQPLQLTLANMGYEAFKGACYTKINKYMIRAKDNEVQQLQKASHIISIWIEEAQRQAENKTQKD